ncbi:hypothetical protein ACLB2K_005526 [Fragaria x ananassa]
MRLPPQWNVLLGEREQEEEESMAATLLVSCNPNVNHACRNDNPPLPKSFMGVGHKILDQTSASINQGLYRSQTKRSSYRFSVSAVTKGSAKSSKSDEKIPPWARPDSEEPPPWAQSKGKKDDLEQGFEVPFYVYLLASAVTAIAAIGSVFEYVNDKPVFGVLYSDSIFYAPVLGFFAFTGIPTSAFLWFKSVQAANKEAEEQDKRDGYRVDPLQDTQPIKKKTQSYRIKKRPSRLASPSLSMASVETCVEHELPVSTGQDYKTRSEQVQRAQWLRAAILGASDGLLSTTSLMLGVGAVNDDRWSMILSGVAGAVAGACSMAVGEYVSVSTQRDIEKVSLNQSSSTLNSVLREIDGNGKVVKLNIPESSFTISVEPTTTRRSSSTEKPTDEPTEKIPTKINTFKIKETDEEDSLPSPHKAASASALAFLCGSLVPLLSAMFIFKNLVRMMVVVVVTSVALALFGAIAARMGGSSVRISAIRVLVGGWIAMAVTYGLLRPFDKDNSKDRMEALKRQFLEEKHCLSSKHSSSSSTAAACESSELAQDRESYKSLSSAIEEVHCKGTLMERVAMLESRVLQEYQSSKACVRKPKGLRKGGKRRTRTNIVSIIQSREWLRWPGMGSIINQN